MAVDNFIYQGINRAVSDYTGARACEELINLRPTEGGLIPVKDFSALFSNVDWEKVFVHYTTSGPKYIVVKRGSSAVEVYYLINASDPTSLSSLFSVTGLNTDAKMNDVLEHLYFAAAGNILLFSICAPTAGKYENHAFTWKMNESLNPPAMGYVETEANVPNVTYSVSSTLETATTGIAPIDDNSERSEIVDSVQSGLNAIQEDNPNLCFGPIVIAVAFKTNDGQIFWTDKWSIYDPIPSVNGDDSVYLTASSTWDWNDYYVDSGFYAAHEGAAYSMIPLINYGTQGGFKIGPLKEITAPGAKVTLSFPVVNGWNKDTSIIQSVEVYCSKPVVFLDADAAGDGYHYQIVEGTLTAPISTLLLPKVKYNEMNLDGQLLYFQASISMEALAASSQTVNLNFGGSIQMTEETLDADAGALQRFGRILSYNARFHYFDSVAKIKIGMPSFNFPPGRVTPTLEDTDIFVRYADDDQSGLVYLDTIEDMEYISPAYCVIAPSINIKEVVTCAKASDDKYYIHRYRMAASSSYNFAVCMDNGSMDTPSTTLDSELQTAKAAGTSDIITNVEPDAINVTEQYNPFVFRVEHSYKAPGNIIDVQPQMAGIVDASYGRDPLNVFTERGLYALTQGSADVLYGAFLPLSNLKASRGGIPVESGTYFLADGDLWLVSGRRVVLISEALTPGPHKYIRACLGYKKLSGQDSTFSPTPAITSPFPVYDASPYLSQVTFEEFVRGNATAGKAPATLSYNRFRQELFVSSKSYNYTYVVSLKTGQWHKISRKVWQDDPGSPIINIPGSATSTISILDMSSEVSSSATPLLIHLQSRPFSMGYQYAHIHRIVAMMRAKLPSAAYKVTAALYGSDDLQHWNLLSYGKWAGKTEEDPTTHETTDTPLFLSQLRTPSAARSWRYYTVCIGGQIPVNTDFPTDIGPVLVDYKPVVRRLG